MVFKHILIIDSDPNARQAMSTTLRHTGYRVSSVLDEDEALALLGVFYGEKAGLDLVIIDTGTPCAFGRRLADALKRNNPAIPSLMVSNFTDKAFIIDLVSHGNHKFIENICRKKQANMRIWDVNDKNTGRRISHEKG